ncbi:MAG: sn-glycerol-3-phosphate ABC transporter ATP-binding protein UgpC [Proteobacteria bacterium]|nr:sn-glycerol-3-phosphate ABC transporter ATP-binding protein UgpC [Pseudomonadota bacterium]NIS72321.1 sn-glycerol-3-phosphate ABC transporter ATP-binding protein UgpC [Pseudomonadota bacterium]
MATVSFHYVTKRFGNFVAVKDFDLGIGDKEFVVLVGPSGCGKSTSLRMLAGLEKITEGTIEIDGRVVNNVHPKDRDIAMVFQNYALYPHMTVYKNMAFGLQLRRFPKSEVDKRVHDAAEILEISELLKRKPRELSGGQRQRVAVGRAIVRKPSVFLFDEPLSNLDAKLRVQMRGEILKLHHRLQSTIIYVTHDQIEAMTMGSKIVIMNAGEIMQVGEPIKVYDSPDNMFVAGFIGSPAMNFLEVKLISKDRALWVDGGEFCLPIPDSKGQKYAQHKGKTCYFGIRPEHMYDREFIKDYDPRNVIKARVDLIEPVGSFVILQIVVGKATIVAQVDSHTRAVLGEEMDLVADMEKMHLFSTDPPHLSLSIS